MTERLFERALKIDEKIYGLDYPNIAALVDNLSNVLLDIEGMVEHAEVK
jgi:hypothetical protein